METLKTIDKNLTTIQTTDIIEDLYIRFIDYLDVSKKTIETYSRALKQFFKFLSVNNINRPDRKDVIYFKDQIKSTHKPTTVQNYIVAVRLFFSWAEQEGLYKKYSKQDKRL